MERDNSWDVSLLLSFLTQCEHQTLQLEANLEATTASSAEHCKYLVQQMRSNLEEAISLANVLRDPEGLQPPLGPDNTAASDSPHSHSGSPRSDNSERAFKEHERREMCKKRKTLPKWTRQVRVSGGSGVGEGLEDGFSWRKYGQKGILGARHPRGYYRCTHRKSVGCLATKQVQRSDKDPCVFDVSYRGQHTCMQKLQSPNNDHNPQLSLEVKAEDLDAQNQGRTSLSCSFSFPPSPLSFAPESHHMFSSATPIENNYVDVGGFSAPLISPATSEPNYLSVPAPPMSSHGQGLVPIISEPADLTEIISAAASTSNSSLVNATFVLDHLEFNPNFSFDPSNLF